MSTLDSFVKSSQPSPKPVYTSQLIKDRDSIFVASIYIATSPAAAHKITKYVKNVVHGSNPATHNMMAYRIVCLKSGHSGLSGPEEFEVNGEFDDDGEKSGGSRILKVMQKESVLDAVVVVSRWYGGTLLGPVRFTHIENCTKEVCARFRAAEELQRYLERLHGLDKTLADLRSQLAGDGDVSAPDKHQTYFSLAESLDLEKARRLIKARENSIRSVQSILLKKGKISTSTENNASDA